MAFRATMSVRTRSCVGCVMLPKITLLLLFAFVRPHPLHAAEFFCSSGDATCLIAAVNSANDTPEEDTITLGPGPYTLTTVDNNTDGPNGLPSIKSTVTIRGAGADRTILERDGAAPVFRLVHIASTGSLILDEVTLRGGVVRGPGVVFGFEDSGGAILNFGTLSIMNSVLTGNSVRDQRGSGGAIAGVGAAVTIVTNTTFASNFVRVNRSASGGAINNQGMLAVTNSTFTDNSTFGNLGAGGAIANGGTVSITSSTLARNTMHGAVNGGGGGAFSNRLLGTVMITNSTLADNTASTIGGGPVLRGGGIENPGTGTVTLQNTILAGNRVRDGVNAKGPDCFGAITSLDHNLIGDPTDCTISLLGNDIIGDPGLGEFTDDGTPGGGHFPLLASSQAIDSARPEACPPTDQLGLARIGICDIGAVEFQTAGLEVVIDIRPRSEANKINPKSHGKIPVVIFTREEFDATTVEPNTVRFGRTGSEATPVSVRFRDVDRDGRTDMVVRFETQDTGIMCGDTSAILTGQTANGLSISGSSSLTTVGCGKPK
jgi:hypothetical protein